jgi:hypothetical protein
MYCVISYIALHMIAVAPNHSPQIHLQEVLETELGTIYFYDNIVMMEAKEDVVLSLKTGIFILLKVISMVGTKPVVYISNRINSYAVAPTDYKYLELIPNLKGIAVVNYLPHLRESVELERRFFKKPFESFNCLEDAKKWAQYMLGE